MSILSVLQGDVLTRLKEIPDESVQCCVTSPPYFGLRNYGLPPSVWGGDSTCEHEWGEYQKPFHPGQVEQTKWKKANAAGNGGITHTGQYCAKCGTWKGCLGNEPDHRMFVQHLVTIFSEVKRVLRSDGVAFLNIGDSYNSSPAGNKPGWEGQKKSGLAGVKEGSTYLETRDQYREGTLTKPRTKIEGVKPKDLLLVPERLAIALQDDGWYVRSRIAWVKGSCLPESIQDRPTSAWEHIWMLTKNDRYYWDKEGVAEPSADAGKIVSLGPKSFSKGQAAGAGIHPSGNGLNDTYTVSPTRNLRNWWHISQKRMKLRDDIPEKQRVQTINELLRLSLL